MSLPQVCTARLDPGTGLTSLLQEWGEQNRRDLPWRRTRDPWAVLVSETMLQQTQVARVVPRYEAWMRRWPAAADLAAAPAAEVITAWSGLGYNRRAVQLRAAATLIVARHGGQVPATLAELLGLPGVGRYTARAVLVFAFEQTHGVVDVNAARVLARTQGRPLAWGEAQRLADRLTPVGRSWAHNQAMLDLGATICTARAPACPACPLGAAGACAWKTEDDEAAPDPALASAGASRRQATFDGSDRQGRGRLVAALTAGPVAAEDLAGIAGWPAAPARVARVVDALVADGLARYTADGGLALPEGV